MKTAESPSENKQMGKKKMYAILLTTESGDAGAGRSADQKGGDRDA